MSILFTDQKAPDAGRKSNQRETSGILLSLDLEMNQPSGRIIQIGAVAGNLATGEVLGTYDAIVDPQEPITDFILNLTSIGDGTVLERGQTLLGAYEGLRAFAFQHNCEMNPLTWGGGDSVEIRAQLESPLTELDGAFDTETWPFGRRWIDAKTVFQAMRRAHNMPLQAGLASALGKCGMAFKGRKHYAPDDARNTFYIYRWMLLQMKMCGNTGSPGNPV